VASDEVRVESVDYDTYEIVVDSDLGFTPLNGYEIDLVGFIDGGLPYRII
jgi:hypothetical protein